MITLTRSLLVTFALMWALASVVTLALPALSLAELDSYKRIVDLVLNWLTAQAGYGMALAAAAALCAVAGRPVWALIGLLLLVIGISLSVTQLDPRIGLAMPEDAAALYDAARTHLPLMRLGGFLTLCLMAAVPLVAQERTTLARLLSPLTFLLCVAGFAAASQFGIELVAVFAFPAAMLLAVLGLRLAEGETPGDALMAMGLVATIIGCALAFFSDARIDLRPAFVAVPLLLLSAQLRQPNTPPLVQWGQAIAVVALLAYLAPAMNQFGDVRTPSNFLEIRAAVAQAARLSQSAGLLLVCLTLGTMLHFRKNRTDKAPRSRATSLPQQAPVA